MYTCNSNKKIPDAYIRKLPLHALPSMLIAVETTKNIKHKKQIKNVCKNKFSITLSKQCSITLPSCITIPKYVKNNIIKQILNTHITNTFIRTILTQRTKFCMKFMPTTGKLLFNHIAHDKNINYMSEPKCMCKFHNNKYPPIFRMRDHTDNVVSRIAKLGAKYVPWPSMENVKKQIRTSIHEYIAHIQQSSPTKILFDNDTTSHNIKKFTTTISKYITTNTQPTHNTIYENEIWHAKNILKGYVITPADKNNNEFIIQCPHHRKKQINKTYINAKHFKTHKYNNTTALNINKNKILQQFTNWAQKHGEEYETNAKLPYAYVLPKDKDLERPRPVTSYCAHPLKKLLTKVSVVINFLLISLPKNNFNLDKVNDVTLFLSKLKDTNDALSKHTPLKIFPFSFDIKEMFTNLKHTLIEKSIVFLFSYFSKMGLTGVFYNESNHTCSLKSNAIKFRFFSFKTLLSVLMIDMNLSFSTVGNSIILLQTTGIPIGSPISPALARLSVSFFECQKLSMSRISKWVMGGRYTDDLLLGVIATSPQHACLLKNVFTMKLYNDGLDLKEEKMHPTSFEFVGHMISFDFDFGMKNVNAKNILFATNNMKKIRFSHFSSNDHVNAKNKAGVVIGELHRAAALCSNENTLMLAVLMIFAEFLRLGHKESLLTAAFHATAKKKHIFELLPNPKVFTQVALSLLPTDA